MSIFGSILGKIFHAAEATVRVSQTKPAAATTAENGSETSSGSPSSAIAASAPPSTTGPSPTTPPATVDVQAVLSQIASQKGGGGNWQTSIVDLLKLLDLDSSLDARKTLANELDTHIAADGSAEENTALHKAVMQKLAANGGKVPASMTA